MLRSDIGVPFQHHVVCDYSIKLLTKDVAQEMKVQTRTATPVNHSGTGFRFTDGDGTTLGALDVEWWTPYIVKRCVRIVATVTNICA